MYFPNNQLVEATNYIAGMDIMQNEPLGEEFRTWLLKNKLASRSSVYWPKLVVQYMDERNIEDANQVHAFLSLFSDFLTDHEHA